jgi:hypothetical protein
VNIRSYYRMAIPIIILLLAYLLIVQYNERTVLEKAISSRLNADLHALLSTIEENERTYADVTSSRQITEEQARILMTRYESIRDRINDHRALAVDLGQRDENYRYDNSSSNADRLTHLFYGWHESLFKNAAAADLDEQMMRIVHAAYQFNASWNDIAIRYRSTAFLVNKSNWLQLLDDMESRTNAFLEEHELGSIEQVWYNREE